MDEDKNPPAATSGLYRFLGALLMKVRTGRSKTGEVGAIICRQLPFKLSFCPVVSWANQSIGALKHCSLFITLRISDSDLSAGNNNCRTGRIINESYESHKSISSMHDSSRGRLCPTWF